MSEKYPLRIVRVERSDRTRIDVDDDLLGRGVQFPDGTVVMGWYRGAYPESDRLEHPHRSVYGSLDDVEQGTGGDVTVELDEQDPSRADGGDPDSAVARGLARALDERVRERTRKRAADAPVDTGRLRPLPALDADADECPRCRPTGGKWHPDDDELCDECRDEIDDREGADQDGDDGGGLWEAFAEHVDRGGD